MTMLEDYWLPTRDGKGTQVDTLPPGQSFDQIEDILYFQKKLYNSLGVPVTRLNPDNQYTLGVATEITRDEVKFGKFIARMRNQFSTLFIKMLEKQLVLKGIMTIQDYQRISKEFRFDFAKDNYFTELKNNQIMGARNDLAHAMVDFAGRFYSNTLIRKNILMQSDEEIEEIDQQIADESMMPQYQMTGMESQGGIMADPDMAGDSGVPPTSTTPPQQNGADQQQGQTPQGNNGAGANPNAKKLRAVAGRMAGQ